MVVKKRGLGRGLDALLPREETLKPAKTGIDEIPVEWIKPGKYQPRTYFADDSIAELAASIKAQGLIQPIVVRPAGENLYEIIAGERRWRAAQKAGLEKVPAVIRVADDETALAMSLIDNIQREDLNPLEEAKALLRLVEEFQFTHQEVAEAVGKSRSAVTNMLRLTHLPGPIAEMLVHGDIEMGHARALLTLDQQAQLKVANLIVTGGLNVRQTEELVRNFGKSPKKNHAAPGSDSDTRRLEERLGQTLGQPVQIRHTSKGRGRLIISYSSLDELDGVLAKIGYEE